MKLLYQRILSDFPQTGIRSAFAYGSSVFKQIGQASGSKEMIDFIFVVDDPLKWHRENLKKHRNHYSFLKFLGSKTILKFHCKSWPGVYFNTLVPWESHLIKYGIISTDALIKDLTHWDHLYVSGRLHKPVVWIRSNIGDSDVLDDIDISLHRARQQNLVSAVCAALLTLPETFSEEELYTSICWLSYDGDRRMVLGEDRSKVRRLVWGHEGDFRRLYGPVLSELPQVDWRSAYSDLLMQDSSLQGHRALAGVLPSAVLRALCGSLSLSPGDPAVVDRLAEHPQRGAKLKEALRAIVAASSTRQTVSSVLTAGLGKSVLYGLRKMHKMLFNSDL